MAGIRVAREERPAAPDAVERLLEALDAQPGAWLGCDVASEGLFRKESVACARPALRFALCGRELSVIALSRAGAALLDTVRALGPFIAGEGTLRCECQSGPEVLGVLRRFLAAFEPASAELGLYGAFAFDYFRLGEDAALPGDGRCRFVLYFPEQVLVADAAHARWVNFRWPGVEASPGPVPAAAVPPPDDELPPGGHARRVARGVDRLRRGELQSLVLSQTFRRRVGVPASKAFASLRARNPYPAMFFCNLGGGELLFGASPDQQLRAHGEWVESAPVCGTLRRGADPIEDMEQAFDLLASDKEGAAIALCADSAANEHALVCEPGSVRVVAHRRPYFFSTIIHAISHLRGQRRAGLDAFDLLLAHATPATVTGLPKASAVRAIEEIEADWRGWYAGAVARLGSDGTVDLHTILRAARVAGGVAEVRTGGNILPDSDPEKEEEESALKAQTLFRVLQGQAPDGAVRATGTARIPVRVLPSDDPGEARFSNILAQAGGVVDPSARLLVCSGRYASPLPAGPLVAVGDAALQLLEGEGCRVEALARPAYARPVVGSGKDDEFLREFKVLSVGWYAAHAIRPDALSAGWTALAVSADGWLLAAANEASRRCALFFRPDSVLSLKGGTGARVLALALAWANSIE